MFARQVADTTCRFSCVHDELVLSFLPAAAATPTHAYVIGVRFAVFIGLSGCLSDMRDYLRRWSNR